MGDHQMNNKSDHIVAEKIIKKLLEKQLLPQDKKKEWIKKLSLGEVFYEDWNLLADFYIKKENEIYEQG